MTPASAPVSVILPTRDRPGLLRAAIRSLHAALGPVDELIVVDSASVDSTVREVITEAQARYVRCDEPGVDRARNAGWKAATNELVAFVDDDVRVAPDWIDAIRKVADAFPEVSFFTGWIGAPENRAQTARPVATKIDTEPARLDNTTRGDLGHSANLVVRRAALDLVGGFDEALGAGGRFRSAPEVDLFDRLFAAGHVGRYSPEIRAWHEQWRGKAALLRLDWRYGFGTGARLAKLVRSDRRRARAVAADFLWTWTGRQLLGGARQRNKFVVGSALARYTGVVAGFFRALVVRVRDGHFVLRGTGRRDRRHP